jgi:putative transposase
MAVPKRHAQIAGTYFVTSRTWESRALFFAEENCSLFVESLLHYRDKGAFALHSFVLMPDHFHTLLTPSCEVTLERAVQFIKGGSAHRMRGKHPLASPVWQRGFSDHRIRDAGGFSAHVRYIEQNSIRKRLVTVPSDYRWSSATGHYSLDPIPQGLKPAEKAAAVGTAKAVP